MPNFKKIASEYDAMRQDIRTLNQKIDGLQRCFEDSAKLVRSAQQQTVSEIEGAFRQSWPIRNRIF